MKQLLTINVFYITLKNPLQVREHPVYIPSLPKLKMGSFRENHSFVFFFLLFGLEVYSCHYEILISIIHPKEIFFSYLIFYYLSYLIGLIETGALAMFVTCA